MSTLRPLRLRAPSRLSRSLPIPLHCPPLLMNDIDSFLTLLPLDFASGVQVIWQEPDANMLPCCLMSLSLAPSSFSTPTTPAQLPASSRRPWTKRNHSHLRRRSLLLLRLWRTSSLDRLHQPAQTRMLLQKTAHRMLLRSSAHPCCPLLQLDADLCSLIREWRCPRPDPLSMPCLQHPPSILCFQQLESKQNRRTTTS